MEILVEGSVPLLCKEKRGETEIRVYRMERQLWWGRGYTFPTFHGRDAGIFVEQRPREKGRNDRDSQLLLALARRRSLT